MKKILLMVVFIASQAAAMDNRKVIVTVDPNKLSPAALKALFDAISSCQHENAYMNRQTSLEVKVLGAPAASVNTGPSLLIREFVKGLPNAQRILQEIGKENESQPTRAKL